MQHAAHRNTRRRSGFTLIELLVVIGIILLLISILLPVVNNVRKAVRNTTTRQMIARLEAGMGAYVAEQGAYPGPFYNNQIGTEPKLGTLTLAQTYSLDGTSYTTESSRVNITSTENMFLGLMGGLRLTATQFRTELNFVDLPQAPMSLNMSNIKRYSQYVNIEPRETTAMNSPRTLAATDPFLVRGFGGTGDTRVPEVLDTYTEPMPILYIRAVKGVAGITSTDDSSAQYNRNHLLPYGFPAANDAAYLQAYPSDGVLAAGDQTYFGNPNTSTAGNFVPYQRDGFILISAGPDGVYGTPDDITNIR